MDAPLVWRARIDEGCPPSRGAFNETIVDESRLWTPLKGSCALPLVVHPARARRPRRMDFLRRVLTLTGQGGANLSSHMQ
jgi:hypothetical protein